MNEQHTEQLHETTASTVADPGHSQDLQLFKPDVSLMILTWLAFIVLLFVLTKYAWKPILDNLDQREETIRRSVEEADRIRRQMEQLEQTKAQMIEETRQKSALMIEEARKASRNAGKVIEDQAKSQAQITLENAERDAKEASNKAYFELKKQSADLVIALASRLVRENMNEEKNKKLVNDVLKDIAA